MLEPLLPSALYEAWWSCWITDMTPPPLPTTTTTSAYMHTHALHHFDLKHTHKISLPGWCDLHFYNALHLLYIFKLIHLQYAKPTVCLSFQNINSHLHRRVYKLSGNIRSQQTPIFPPKNNEAWQSELPKRTVGGLLRRSPALNFPLNHVLLI